MKIILGIDPGSVVTGFGILAVEKSQMKTLDHGVIKLPAGDFANRLHILSVELEKLIARHKPSHLVIEKVFLGKNVDSAFKLGHARGVCLMLAAKFGLNIQELATRQVKKVLTGNGAADKEQVRFMVEKLLRIHESKLDATDALALAICGARDFEMTAREVVL